jgi:hypothetical protein
MSDVTEQGMYPPDFYDPQPTPGTRGLSGVDAQLHLYGQGSGESQAMDRATLNLINSIHGDPNAMVTIYRAVPKDVTAINPGDWVTPSRSYAELHADSNLGGMENARILQMQVPASQLWTNADSIEEWGWNPPNFEQFNADTRARAWAANLGKAYNQDGVLLFTPDKSGESVMATFRTKFSKDKVEQAMKDAGISGGRFTTDGRLQVIGSGEDFVKQLTELSKKLAASDVTPESAATAAADGSYDIARGNFAMMERDKGDYQKALDALSHPKGVTTLNVPTADAPPSVDLPRGPPITGFPTNGFGAELEKITKMNDAFLQAPQKEWVEHVANEEDIPLGVNMEEVSDSMEGMVEQYTQSGSQDINGILSGDITPANFDEKAQQYGDYNEAVDSAKAMQQLVDSAPPLPEGTTLYRGINAFNVNPELSKEADAAAREIIEPIQKKWGLDKPQGYEEYDKIMRDPAYQKEHAKGVQDAYEAITKTVGNWAAQQYPVGSYVAMGEPGEFESMTLNANLAARFGAAGGAPDTPGTLVFKVVNAKTGAPIFPFSRFTDESEILAPPNTMYRVRSVELAKMDVIDPHSPLGKSADKVVVTLEEAPKCGPVTAALTATTGVACTNVAQYVPDGKKPKATVGNSVLFPGQSHEVGDAAASHRASAIRRYAEANNMSEADYKAAAQEAIRSYIAEHPQIRIRLTHNALEKVIDTGKFVNEFALPGVTSDMLAGRVVAEKNLFGIAANAGAADRPIYGYLAGTADETGEVQEYGDIIANLNPDVNARATFTIGDSYSAGINQTLSPSLLSDPGIGSWDGSFDIVKAYREGRIADIARYVEVEIHGGLPLSDVGGVHADQALVVAREDATRLKEAIEAATEIYANSKGTQYETPQVEQSGVPADQPSQFDYAKALNDMAKNAGLRQGALADLIARVGLRGVVADDFEDFNITNAIGA